MISLKIKRGYNVNLAGKPADTLTRQTQPQRVALLPEKIPFVKPRLLVKQGDAVTIGTPLIEDKRRPDIRFLSPGGGTVEAVNLGPRRVIREIVIKLDQAEKYTRFDPISLTDLAHIERFDLIHHLQQGGVWPFLRELPFRDIAVPERIPPVIWVCADSLEQFQPEAHIYLKNDIDFFQLGIAALDVLAHTVNIAVSAANPPEKHPLAEMATHCFHGKYPADDPGTLLYHTRVSADDNRAWYITGQDVIQIGRLLKNGTYPIEKTICVSGESSESDHHIVTRTGTPINHLIPIADDDKQRFIAGGIFRGYPVEATSYLGYYESSVTVLPKGDDPKFFGFMRPGLNQPSFSRTFLSVFKRQPLKNDSSLHGEERACINCGSCANICAVDILPQFTYKCLVADEIEEALSHGLLDCVTCGLCSYVCPSKIELSQTFEAAKRDYYKDQQ